MAEEVYGEVLEFEHDKVEVEELSEDIIDIYRGLRPKHAMFVDLYIKYGRNGYKAYREVYPNTTEGSAYTGASNLLAREDVSLAILKISNFRNTQKQILDLNDVSRMFSDLAYSSDPDESRYALTQLKDINLKLLKINEQIIERMERNREKELTTGNITFEMIPASKFLEENNKLGENDE